MELPLSVFVNKQLIALLDSNFHESSHNQFMHNNQGPSYLIYNFVLTVLSLSMHRFIATMSPYHVQLKFVTALLKYYP